MLHIVGQTRLRSGIHGLFAPIPIGFLVQFRIIFGAFMLYEVWMFIRSGVIDHFYIHPEIHYTYYFFSWLKPWPGHGMYWHFYLLGLAAAGVMLGCFYRVSATVMFVAFSYVFLLERARYLNHLYLMVLLSLLLAFVPAHRMFSIDALMRPHLRSATVPAWTLWLFRFQLGIVYGLAGIAKIDSDWLSGYLMRRVLSSKQDLFLLDGIAHEEWFVSVVSYGGMLFDLLIVPALLFRKTRILALIVAVCFHLTNAMLFDIDVFPWLMIASTIIFFFPEWTSVRPQKRTTQAAIDRGWKPAISGSPTGRRRLALGLAAVYVATQILMPLRHYAYPGNANWTEEGQDFSWRMMLRIKVPFPPRFPVSFTKDGKQITTEIKGPRSLQYIRSHWQFRRMLVNPDMILQFCHYHANELRQRGCTNIEIRAIVPVSLNGREPQPLVDPKVNLAAERRTIWPANWILPLVETLPTQSRS